MELLLFFSEISNLKPTEVVAKLPICISKSLIEEPSAVVLVEGFVGFVVSVVAFVVVVVASVVVVVASVVVVVASVVVVVASVVVVVASVVVVVASVVVVVGSSSLDSVVFFADSVAIVSTCLLPKRLLNPDVLSNAHKIPIARTMIARKVMSPARPGSF